MKQKCYLFIVAAVLVGCTEDAIVNSPSESVEVAAGTQDAVFGKVTAERTRLHPFLPAGDIAALDENGNSILCSDDNPCPLEPGTFFPATNRSVSILRRTDDAVHIKVLTSGLPAGAYTTWWVFFNNPDACEIPVPEIGAKCGGGAGDDFANPAVETSIYWSSGGIVESNGNGAFADAAWVGEDRGTPGEQDLQGSGLLNPKGAEVHYIVKYHGPASDDPEELLEQTTTLLGGCFNGVNAIDLGPTGKHCFDPQFSMHTPSS